ncbi:hypothetical protein V6N11_059990 [Hibiscus sabdariffa]|uniref:Uncharacterized protein n=1 Tax=Hibiscus sabdariffa TaxID=183260 RepID=A0ABR2NZ95_9ROSI
MKRVMVREVLSPARYRWLYEKRVEEADNLVRYVHNQCKDSGEGGLVNLRVVAQHYCSNVTRKLMFNRRYFGEGKQDGGPGFEEEEYVEAIFAFIVHLYSFCISDYLPFLRGLDLEGHEKIVEDAIRVMEKYQDPIIEDRIQQWRDGKKDEPQDLLDEINVATVDNPSNALEWAFAEIAKVAVLYIQLREERVLRSDAWKFDDYHDVCEAFAWFRLEHPANQRTIDLSQGKGIPFLTKPLLAIAKPRLSPSVYSLPE